MIGSAFALSIVGVVSIYSATYWKGPELWDKQFVSLLLSIPLIIVLRFIDYRFWMRIAPYLYMLSLLLLVGVFILSPSIKGAKRWIYFGDFSFQPSEIGKLTLIFMLARIVEYKRSSWKEFSIFTVGLLLTVIPAGLIAIQPDLGTAVVFIFIFVAVIFISCISLKYLIGLLGLGIVSIPLVWNFLLRDYQKERILTFMDPTKDPLGAGYHIIQSKLAIGSGELFGYGFLNGPQNRLKFIPEQHTDFIFSLIGEEFGFIGALVVISLFIVLFLVGLSIASKSETLGGVIMGVGIISMLCIHMFVNIGMTIGLLPVTGIPLPFISYGRSGLITNMIAIGILSSLRRGET
ncbi:MAG: rod shape-determining protein RodA [bacterium]